MDLARRKVLAFMGSLWLAIPLCLLLHEGGHALVALVCGGSITAFNVVEAYVIVDGGDFTTSALALFYVAGVSLNIVIWYIYLCFYKKGKGMFYHLFSAVYSIMNLFAIGVWIVVPIKEMLGWANPIDDVVKWISVTHMAPLKIAVIASLVWLLSFWLIWQKGIFINAIEILKKH